MVTTNTLRYCNLRVVFNVLQHVIFKTLNLVFFHLYCSKCTSVNNHVRIFSHNIWFTSNKLKAGGSRNMDYPIFVSIFGSGMVCFPQALFLCIYIHGGSFSWNHKKNKKTHNWSVNSISPLRIGSCGLPCDVSTSSSSSDSEASPNTTVAKGSASEIFWNKDNVIS